MMLWGDISLEGAWGTLGTVASGILAFFLAKAKLDAKTEVEREKTVAKEIAELRAREQEALNRWIAEVKDSQKIVREESEKRQDTYVAVCIELKDVKAQLKDALNEIAVLKTRPDKSEAH